MMTSPGDTFRRVLTRLTHRIHTLPVLVISPHSRCNCRCVMCDIWKGHARPHELSQEEIERRMAAFRKLGVRWVLMTGGEALMHSDLFPVCRLFREEGMRVTLLSTGLLLKKYTPRIVSHCSDVIVSLDGSRHVHDRIRNVPRAFDRLAEGVEALKTTAPAFRITGRCVLQKLNYHDLPHIITAARTLRLDQISFLGADVSSTAFNRPVPWDEERRQTVALDRAEVNAFAGIVERVVADHAEDFKSGFIAESPDGLRRIITYYRALNGDGAFPPVVCNAPWVSAVVEADGTVRPCFFHRALGNLYETPLDGILNGEDAVRFRKSLDVSSDPICRRCVCSLHLSPTVRV